MLAEALRWAVIAAITAAAIRFPRSSGFWSIGPRQSLVLARVHPDGPSRFRQAAKV